jgi:SAM-dependent methyltransferase
MKNALVRVLGWRATILQGDPTVADRWHWLRKHLRGGPLRTLDAGCGTGAFTMYAARAGNQALGLAFEADQLERARARAAILGIDGATFRAMDLRELGRFADSLGKFDQILLFETIEHIKDDRKLIADLAALLEPGGTLLLTAPYKGHHPLHRAEKVSEVEDGGHVRWGYTHEEMEEILRGAGLEVLAREYISGPVSQKVAGLTFTLRGTSDLLAWAVSLPLKPLVALDPLLSRATKYPALSIGVVARKPDAGAGAGAGGDGRP